MSNPETKTRWLRRPGWMLAFGVFMVIVLALLVVSVHWQRQQNLIAEIQALGGQVETAAGGPPWLRSAIGKDHMRGWDPIVGINLADRDVDDQWLSRILHLRDLEWIDLTATGVTERGLERVANLPALREIYIEESGVADEALADLDAAHPDVTLIRGRRAPVAMGLAMRRIHWHAFTCAVFSPDDSMIVCGDGDGNLMGWNPRARSWRRTSTGVHENWLFDATFSPNGEFLVTVGGDNAIRVFDAGSHRPLDRLTPHADDIHAVVVTPHGESIITAGDDCTICVTDVSTLETVSQWIAHEEAITCLAISPDGGTLVSGSRDDSVRFWSLETGEQVARIDGHSDDVHSVAFSPNGDYVASASYDHSVQIHRPTGEFVREFSEHTDWVFSVAFSPDGTDLASGSGDGTVRIWDVETGDCRHVLERQRTVSSVCFSYDGQYLATAAADGNLCLWDPTDGRLLSVAGSPYRAHP